VCIYNFVNPIYFRSPSFLLACGGSRLEEFGWKVQLSCVVSAKVGVELEEVIEEKLLV
jgi:hypothetical protein